MSSARVYFVPFGGKHAPEEVGEGLARAAGFLRGEVGRALALRHAPKLEFVYDAQIEHADKLTRLIDGAVKSNQNKPE
jgi:ribosome-binding factor A